jgi:hypothetical protein
MIVNLLIVFFFLLLLYQFLTSCKREGLENSAGTYKDYPEDPLILGKQNAGNIEVLRKEVEQIPEIKNRINILEEDVKILNEQIIGLNEQNAEAVSSFSKTTDMLTGFEDVEGDEDEEPIITTTTTNEDLSTYL